jgi:uncharacterized membrane protein
VTATTDQTSNDRASNAPKARRGYVDWVRGVAVLIMIQAHLFDSWTRVDVRDTWQFKWAMIVAGFGAPLFLFLAGTSVALSAGAKSRRSGDPADAARAVMARGGWLFVLAFLFRIQAWILGWGAPRTLLKVDILNIMGPSIVAAAALWGAFRTARARCLAAGAVAAAIALLTPLVRWTPLLDALPDPIEAYLRPVPRMASFFFFPWAGFVFAGAVAGVLLDGARAQPQEARLNRQLFVAGAVLTTASYVASFFPSVYPQSDFWTTAPTFFLLRVGILILLIPAAYLWQNTVTRSSWSPIQQLGRTSLFIYWIHVEMVYGLISLRIHKSLTHPQAWAAYLAFSAFMLLCSIAKDRWAAKRRKRKGTREKEAVSLGHRTENK